MGKSIENRYYILCIRTNDRDSEYPKWDTVYFSDPIDMLNRIDEIKKERVRQGERFTRHIDYDYIYLL